MDDPVLSIIGRDRGMFTKDLCRAEPELSGLVESGSFLVIGGAGSIGQAVAKEVFKYRGAVTCSSDG